MIGAVGTDDVDHGVLTDGSNRPKAIGPLTIGAGASRQPPTVRPTAAIAMSKARIE